MENTFRLSMILRQLTSFAFFMLSQYLSRYIQFLEWIEIIYIYNGEKDMNFYMSRTILGKTIKKWTRLLRNVFCPLGLHWTAHTKEGVSLKILILNFFNFFF